MKKTKLLIPFAMLATLSSTCMITSCNNPSKPDPSESFTLTFRAGEHGRIIGQTEIIVSAESTWGEVNKPTAQPDNGYKIDGWYFNGKQLVNTDKISSNMDIEVRFIKKTDEDFVTLNFNTDGNGVLEGETTITVDKGLKWGDITPPKAINNAGYTFNGWYYNEHQMEDSDELSDGMSIQARFIEKEPTLASSFEWELDTGSRTAAIKNFIGDETEIIIPSQYTDTNTNVTYNVTTIKESAFNYSGCDEIKLVKIPDSITSIGKKAFKSCSGITSLYIGSGVTSLDYSCFEGCTNIQDLTVCNSNSNTIPNLPKNNLIWVSIKGGSLGEKFAFQNCTKLTSISFGRGVTSIWRQSFIGCDALTSIQIDKDNEYCTSQDSQGIEHNCIIEKESKELICGCKTTTIPSDVKSIGEDAFALCIGLTSIEIPDSVTSIESGAFYKCNGLKRVTIGSGVTDIGQWAFNSCENLTTVTLGSGLEKIGLNAFSSCIKLTNITYNGTKSQFDNINRISFSWHYDVPTGVVHCTDGDYTI